VKLQTCPYHVTFDLDLEHTLYEGPVWGQSCASLVAIQPFRTVFEILSLKVIWVTILTFWGHVTSSVTWP